VQRFASRSAFDKSFDKCFDKTFDKSRFQGQSIQEQALATRQGSPWPRNTLRLFGARGGSDFWPGLTKRAVGAAGLPRREALQDRPWTCMYSVRIGRAIISCEGTMAETVFDWDEARLSRLVRHGVTPNAAGIRASHSGGGEDFGKYTQLIMREHA
jgi:hypothetical protein